MSFRTVYGYSRSENGWRMVNRDGCVVGGPSMGLPYTDTASIRHGDASTILVAWLYWYHHNVEPLTSSVWGWSATNAVANSNHLSGTALDINAPKYPFGRRVMPLERIAKVRAGLRLFEGTVFWGADWSYPDEMHYQLGYPEGDRRIASFAHKLNTGYLDIYDQEEDVPFTDADRQMLKDILAFNRDIWTQLRGPGGKGWPQLGKNDQGQNLTMVDGIAAVRADVNRVDQ